MARPVPLKPRILVLTTLLGAGACQVYSSDLVDSSATLISTGGTTSRGGSTGASAAASAGEGAPDCRDCYQAGAGASGDDAAGAGGMDDGGLPANGGATGTPVGGSGSAGDAGGTPTGGTPTGGTPTGGTATGGTPTGGTATGGTPTGGTATGGTPTGGTGGSSSTPTCAGAQVSGQCLYLSAVGASCESTCATHGGVAPDATALLGTPAQGGTLQDCSAALKALGVSAPVNQAVRYDGRGLGCHLYDSVPFWLTSPAFSTTIGYVRTRIVCACSE